METRSIGGLTVSVVGVGCNNFGQRVDAAATSAIVDAALDSGINFFDTADKYGGTLSEEYLGAALQARRNRAVVATKFGLPLEPGQKGGGSPVYVRTAVEASLTRLRTDRIDLYQIHQPDPDTPIAETLAALGDLVREGKVREIGCSKFSAEQLAEAHAAVAEGAPRFVSAQAEYSLLRREGRVEVSTGMRPSWHQAPAFLPVSKRAPDGKVWPQLVGAEWPPLRTTRLHTLAL